MPITIPDSVNIDIVFEFPQDYSDIVFATESNPSDILVSYEDGADISLDVVSQGLEGAKGDTGEKGDKGDALVYNLLTPEEKSEVIAQFDNAIGNTSYANIFLNAYLS